MDKPPALRAATVDELAETLSFALRDQGRRRVHHAYDLMARITADRLVAHLEEAEFVVMRKSAAVAPTTSAMPVPGGKPWPPSPIR